MIDARDGIAIGAIGSRLVPGGSPRGGSGERWRSIAAVQRKLISRRAGRLRGAANGRGERCTYQSIAAAAFIVRALCQSSPAVGGGRIAHRLSRLAAPYLREKMVGYS